MARRESASSDLDTAAARRRGEPGAAPRLSSSAQHAQDLLAVGLELAARRRR